MAWNSELPATSQSTLRLTRNTDDCKSVKFDFNHEHLKIEDTAPADKFQIKAYF